MATGVTLLATPRVSALSMDTTDFPLREDSTKLDWRIQLGLVLTGFWLAVGLYYVFVLRGWSEFIHQPEGDMGSFLEGAFAPLAFLWLVLGHFTQQSEISANTRAIQLQERNTSRLEFLSRRDSFFKLLTLIQEQLGSIASFLYISIEGPTGSKNCSMEEFARQRQLMDQGDYALFVRSMLFLVLAHDSDRTRMHEFFAGTDIRRRHSENFRETFEKLLRAAREVDTDDMINNAIMEGSPMGRLYKVITRVLEQENNSKV